MNGAATFGDNDGGTEAFAVHNQLFTVSARDDHDSAMAAFGIAVAAISVVCYALLNARRKIRRNRRSPGDNSTDGAGTSGGDGWATAIWFGGHHSAIDSSGNPVMSGGSAAAIAEEETAVVGRRWRRRLMRSACGKDQDFDLRNSAF